MNPFAPETSKNTPMMRITRWASVAAWVLAAGSVSAPAQSRDPMTKVYEDVRFKIWYMHWDRGAAPSAPYRHSGPVVLVFLGDGALQASAFGASQRHAAGEVDYLESGSIANGGMLASASPLRALVVELKDVPPSQPLALAGVAPAFPRADATKVFENARVVVWDALLRVGQTPPVLLHDKNTVQAWITGATVERAYPNQPPHRETKAAGSWEMIHAGVAQSEQVVDRSAHLVAIQVK